MVKAWLRTANSCCLTSMSLVLLVLSGCHGDEELDGDAEEPELLAPTDFHCVRTRSGLMLRWTDSTTSEEGYVLERRGPDESEFASLATLPADTEEYLDPDFLTNAGFVYRLAAMRGIVMSNYVYCNSAQKLWTYIRIIDYDSVWTGDEEDNTPEWHLHDLIDTHIESELALVGSSDNLDLVLLGDAYGDGGSIYAYVGGQGETQILAQDELDMGEVSTYENFFDWVVSEHPGQRYVVEYWGHGAGATYTGGALGFDRTSGGEGLTPAEVEQALGHLASASGRPVDLFYLCTCLNQMFENAYEWRYRVKYLVAGETPVGCMKQPISVLAGAEEGMTVEYLARATVEGFHEFDDMGVNVVYSALDLGQAADIAALVDALARALETFFERDETNARALRDVANGAQNMGIYAPSHVDLWDLCEDLVEAIDDVEVDRACSDLLAALREGKFIMAVAHTDALAYPQAHGVSIFHPNSSWSPYDPNFPAYYRRLAFAHDTGWDEYVFGL